MLIISMVLFWRFMFHYVVKKIDTDDSFLYYFEAVVFIWSYIMAIWCLAKTYFGNPGYVKDYYFSVKLEDSEVAGGTERFEIYEKK